MSQYYPNLSNIVLLLTLKLTLYIFLFTVSTMHQTSGSHPNPRSMHKLEGSIATSTSVDRLYHSFNKSLQKWCCKHQSKFSWDVFTSSLSWSINYWIFSIKQLDILHCEVIQCFFQILWYRFFFFLNFIWRSVQRTLWFLIGFLFNLGRSCGVQ